MRWLIAGPIISILTFLYLLRVAKRDDLIEKYPQSVLSEFLIESFGRALELILDSDDSGRLIIRFRVSFFEYDAPSASEVSYDVSFDRKGCRRILPCYVDEQPMLTQEILSTLNQADPPIVPIKWKPGVLTIADKGLEYTEGPYDLGPLAEEGIVGNLTIVEGLKGVVDEVEAIWKSLGSEDEK